MGLLRLLQHENCYQRRRRDQVRKLDHFCKRKLVYVLLTKRVQIFRLKRRQTLNLVYYLQHFPDALTLASL